MSKINCLVDGRAGVLEVILRHGQATGELQGRDYCGLICHPHPLYGGSMDNKVVTTLARTYTELGIPAVCFNFRGVGRSAGGHDDGVGEVEDLRSVAQWAQRQFPNARFLLAGYSFGAAIAVRGCSHLSPAHMTLVAPPVGRFGLVEAERFPCPVFVLFGGQDELVDADAVIAWAAALERPAQIQCLSGASHFFHGELVALRAELRATLLANLG
ncbi:MAG: alpha/beta hydrolase [Porticoccaceae bacterium]